jgi:hypothetical protein
MMEVVENFLCNNDTEARMKEREWYDKIDSQLNNNYPYVHDEEERKMISSTSAKTIRIKKKQENQKNKEEQQECKKKLKESDEYKTMLRERNNFYQIKYLNKEGIKEKKKEIHKMYIQNKKLGDKKIMTDEARVKYLEYSKINNEKNKIRYENDIEYRKKIQEGRRVSYQKQKNKKNEAKEGEILDEADSI